MGPDFSTFTPKEIKQLEWIGGLTAVISVPIALTAAFALGGPGSVILTLGAVFLGLLAVSLGLWLIRLAWVGRLSSGTIVASPRTHFTGAVLLSVHVGLALGGLVVLVLLIIGLAADFGVSVSGPALVYLTLSMMIARAAFGTICNLGVLLHHGDRRAGAIDI